MTGKKQSREEFNERVLDDMRHNPDYYFLGIFYFNRHDPRAFVPKRNRYLGWTLNFYRPETYIVLLTIILAAIFLG